MTVRSAIARALTHFARDDRGATAILLVLVLPVLLGITGLAVDVGANYAARRQAQNAADSAAYSGAVTLTEGRKDVRDHALATAARYGVVDGVDGVKIAVHTPPTSGSLRGDPGAVEVVVKRPGESWFMSLIGQPAPALQVRAVAKAGLRVCLLALDPQASSTILLNGSPSVNLANCSAYDDSVSGNSLTTSGSGSMTARSAELVGGYQSGIKVITKDGVHTGVKPMPDPYADVPAPSYGGCRYTNESVNSGANQTYRPSGSGPVVFCGGLQVNSNATVTFAPGVYVINQGKLNFAGGSIIRGAGVIFYLTGSAGPASVATLQINGGADVQLSAPTSGPLAGLLFFQDRSAAADTDVVNGNSSHSYVGALYFPRQTLTFSGGATVSSDTCVQIVANEIQFGGDSGFSLDGCNSYGVRLGVSAQLVE